MRTIATSSRWKNRLCLWVFPPPLFVHLLMRCLLCLTFNVAIFIFDTMTFVHARAHDRWLQFVFLWFEKSIYIPRPTIIFRGSHSLGGTDLSPVLANEHGYTTRIQRHYHFLHYFNIIKICTDNIINMIYFIK